MCVVFIQNVPHAEQHTSMTTDSEVLAPSHLKELLTKLMEIDVRYAGIYMIFVYYSMQKCNYIFKDLLCLSGVREEL